MESNESQERDWSSLPPEVLNLIAKKKSEITDFVRFRAVCTAWCSSTPISDLPPQFPWIVDEYIDSYSNLKVAFYSIPLEKYYSFYVPNSLENCFFGPSQGYIYMLTNRFMDCELHLRVAGSQSNRPDRPSFQNTLPYHSILSLFNPLNDHVLPLPAYNYGRYVLFNGRWQNPMGELVICYGNDGCEIVKLISWCPGQDNWRVLNLVPGYVNCKHFYLKRTLYSVDRNTGITKVTDIGTGTLISVLPPIEGYSSGITDYLVEASGDILRVVRNRDQHCDPLESEQFEVYRLDVNKNGSPCWFKVGVQTDRIRIG